ncbi:hypothetical protein CFOL_v3_04004 [Cephalotus follicularis]|uniref:Uncharacterized protein n=1 Tax=Cephalotus follicularis TaxID=3775 RepID=A0A1Q3AXU9_CEPFO|nr:hypothetical protein CFOL_v3_04004 [Cephalotus follicularis]
MEKKMPPGSSTDELAIVKAAAWAWYQHGAGYERKPMREFDLPRNFRAPAPSRYKLEAMGIFQNTMEESLSVSPSPIHTDSLLLDSYEVECISKHLDRYIASSGTKTINGLLVGDHGSYKSIMLSNDDTSAMMTRRRKKKKKNNDILKWFWQRHAVVCGTREDVDTRAFIRRRREKHGTNST